MQAVANALWTRDVINSYQEMIAGQQAPGA